MKQNRLKHFMLLLLCMVATGAWADETLFYWTYDQTASVETIADGVSLTNVTGGTLTTGRKANSSKNFSAKDKLKGYTDDVPDDMKAAGTPNSNAYFVKCGSGELYLTATLSEGTFQPGDIIYITGYNEWGANSTLDNVFGNNSKTKGDVMSVTTGADNSHFACVSAAIPEGFTPSNTLYFARPGSNTCGICAIKIVRPATGPKDPVFSFEKSTFEVGEEVYILVDGQKMGDMGYIDYWTSTLDGTHIFSAGYIKCDEPGSGTLTFDWKSKDTDKYNSVTGQTLDFKVVPVKTAVTLAYNPESATITGGEELTQPTLTITGSTFDQMIYDNALVFTSSNESVATVGLDGEITPVGAGTATITASIPDDATYKGAPATFTLTVNAQIFEKPYFVYKGQTYHDGDVVEGLKTGEPIEVHATEDNAALYGNWSGSKQTDVSKYYPNNSISTNNSATGSTSTGGTRYFCVIAGNEWGHSEMSVLQFNNVVAADPVFDLEEGEVAVGDELQISTLDKQDVIYYTMTDDGTEPAAPTQASTKLTKASDSTFGILDVFKEEGKTYKLKAIAYTKDVANNHASAVVAKTYTVPAGPALPGNIIWQSEEPVAAAWDSNAILVAAENLASAKVGDKIHVAVKGVEPADAWSAQVCLRDGAWNNLEAGFPVGDGTVDVATFVLTGDILRYIKTYGMMISGHGYSTDAVSLEVTELTGSDESVWVGSTTQSQTINSIHFNNAREMTGIVAGDIIRVTAELDNTAENHWLLPCYDEYDAEQEKWNWYNYEMTASPQATETGFDYVITDADKALMLQKGLIMNIGGYILTQVEIIPGEVTADLTLTDAAGEETNADRISAMETKDDVTVTVARSVKADQWNTIYLPFAMTAEQIAGAFGEGTKVAGLASYDADNENLMFTSVTETAANTAYLLKPANDVEEFTVEGVDVTYVADKDLSNPLILTPGALFEGVIDNHTIATPASLYYLANGNKIKLLAENGQLKALHGYFIIGGGINDDPFSAKTFTVDGAATGIIAVENGEQLFRSGEMYNTAGQRVNDSYRGVVIVNGKKVIKK